MTTISANRLRILMFSESYGGITNTFIRNEVVHFSRQHQLRYLTLANLTPDVPEDVEVVPWHRRPIWDRIEWRLWQYDLQCSFRNADFGRRLREAIERFRPDVIHCHFGCEALRLLQNVKIAENVPIIVHFHGYDASEMIRKRSYIRALSPFLQMPCVWPIVVSYAMKADLEHVGFDMSRACLLRYGIDLDLFRPRHASPSPRPGDQIVIAQISSLIPKKGHRETLLALAAMLQRNPALRHRIRYRIAGAGISRAAIETLVTSLGLGLNVEFVGTVTPTEAAALLSEADVFVHHSVEERSGHKEGIPNAIIEAMAMELPVLTTQHAGIPELVEHGVHGLLCEERDIDTYSRQMEEIIGWGRRPANRLKIEREYNKVAHNKTLEDIYRRTMKSCAR